MSQTVARMERDELVRVEDDRRLVLTPAGRALATRVMRKHRLAECLLVSVIGLPWEEVHIEACRWEHVISEEVERGWWNCSTTRCIARMATSFPGSPSLASRPPPRPGAGAARARRADDERRFGRARRPLSSSGSASKSKAIPA